MEDFKILDPGACMISMFPDLLKNSSFRLRVDGFIGTLKGYNDLLIDTYTLYCESG